VQVQAPPAQNAMAATTNVPPPETPLVRAAPPAPPPAVVAVTRVDTVCSNYAAVQAEVGRRYARELDRDGSLKGDVQVELTVAESGDVRDVVIKKSSSPVLNKIALNAAQQLKCNGQTHDIRAATSFVFRQD
jgi:TonB family protein